MPDGDRTGNPPLAGLSECGPGLLRFEERVIWLRDEHSIPHGYATAIVHEQDLRRGALRTSSRGWSSTPLGRSSATNHHAVLATLRQDGSPQLTPVLAGVDDAGQVGDQYPGDRVQGQPRPAHRPGVALRAAGRLLRRVDLRRRPGDDRVVAGRDGRPGRVLPQHLRRAPRLGRLPRRDGTRPALPDPD